jgi:hypothetical protein
MGRRPFFGSLSPTRLSRAPGARVAFGRRSAVGARRSGGSGGTRSTRRARPACGRAARPAAPGATRRRAPHGRGGAARAGGRRRERRERQERERRRERRRERQRRVRSVRRAARRRGLAQGLRRRVVPGLQEGLRPHQQVQGQGAARAARLGGGPEACVRPRRGAVQRCNTRGALAARPDQWLPSTPRHPRRRPSARSRSTC